MQRANTALAPMPDAGMALAAAPTLAGQAALDAARTLGHKAAAPATVGAYLASLKDSHAPTTIRRRLSAIGKMHRVISASLEWVRQLADRIARRIQRGVDGEGSLSIMSSRAILSRRWASLVRPSRRAISASATARSTVSGSRSRDKVCFGAADMTLPQCWPMDLADVILLLGSACAAAAPPRCASPPAAPNTAPASAWTSTAQPASARPRRQRRRPDPVPCRPGRNDRTSPRPKAQPCAPYA
jgi:hypothetical protein